MAEPSQSPLAYGFRPRHDLWDAVDFYLYFFALAQFVGLWVTWMAWRQIGTAQTGPSVWLMLPLGLLQSVLATWKLVLHVWKRFAESYELAATELVIDHGYTQMRIPFSKIYGAHPIKICRMTTALKPALRVKFSSPQTRFGSVDLAPVNLELFFSELSVRCPHLRREGPRLFPPEPASMNLGATPAPSTLTP